jgi:capsular polysaccharide biosynthesis protein
MRRFIETNIFSNREKMDENCEVLLYKDRTMVEGVCAAPIFIDNPFSIDFYNLHTKERKSKLLDQYCIRLKNAVLFGERAVVATNGALVTDNVVEPPSRIFTPGTMDFEWMETTSDNGYLHSEKVDKPNIKIDGEAVLLSSSEHYNYGAFLLRQIPKLMTIKELNLGHVPILIPPTPWQSELLHLFGYDNIIKHDRCSSYLCDSLILPSERAHGFLFDDDVRAFFMDFAAKISSGIDVGGHEKVYVSRLQRGKDHPNYRLCLNEEQLIAELVELGFYIFEPDLFRLPEQIATFQQARIVVGPSGAGMFNTIFCNPGTIVIAIEPLDYWFLAYPLNPYTY